MEHIHLITLYWLAIPQHTYDIFSISGQGIIGMFRPHRSDLGTVNDDYTQTISENQQGVTGKNIGLELGFSFTKHFGTNATVITSQSTSGKWVFRNQLAESMKFRPSSVIGDLLYEPFYFKMAGEHSVVDKSFLPYKDIGALLAPKFANNSEHSHIERYEYRSDNGNNLVYNEDSYSRNQRQSRNTDVTMLTVKNTAARLEPIKSYPNSQTAPIIIDRNHPDHHITEITALNTQGVRYVYGIPAYNYEEVSYLFTNNDIGNDQTGLVGYNHDIINNNKGSENDAYDGYYYKSKLPPYAHSYLLTAILDPDYVDVNKNGPDANDLGGYTKINYTRKSDQYKWRTPINQNKALYIKGLNCDKFDDKANIVYGIKDIWIVQSIESKNYIAIFHTSTRQDGRGVLGVHGGVDNSSDGASYKLDSITLYHKSNMSKPIRSVYFEYDYSLCKGSINSTETGQGKLTLKKIYFTNGNSNKGKLSKYEFKYNTGNKNPNYDISAYDRWGYYKPNDPNLPNTEYPYVVQNEQTDEYAQAWSLKEILLPSGGRIHVEYESDDYAYVQDKRAMQMINIVGFGKDDNFSASNLLYESKNQINKFLFVQLPTTPANKSELETDYFDGIRDLYFNCLVNIDKETNSEFVKGYMDIEDYGLVIGHPGKAWIKLKSTSNNAHPISECTWQTARLDLPHLIYKGANIKKEPDPNPIKTARTLIGLLATGLIEGEKDLYQRLSKEQKGSQIILEKSFIKLNNPNRAKKGGGVRVKKIYLNDNWDKMAGNNNASSNYGQVYDYTKVEDGKTISSGVASYEPMPGNDENPLRQPISFNKESGNKRIPSLQYYVDEPLGESFYPAPSVGYSQVTVRSLQYKDPSLKVTRNATGRVEHEFYTARDFPVITKSTPIERRTKEPKLSWGLFKTSVYNHVSVNQGYYIEVNDMHGKQKSMKVYSESNSETVMSKVEMPISGVEYIYETDENNSKKLSNKVQVINNKGEILNAEIGVDVDIINDAREVDSYVLSNQLQFNLDIFLIETPIPLLLIIPTLLAEISIQENVFRSMVISKVVTRYGILKKVIAYEDGASLSTENMLYDMYTGNVLLTKNQNEYKDFVYQSTQPAHWAYEGMGPSYINNGAEFKDKKFDDIKQYFVPGDEVWITGNNINGKYWVTSDKYLIDENDSYFSSSQLFNFKILRSGRRNLLNEPLATATSLNYPILDSISRKWLRYTNQAKIINAKAFEYTDMQLENCNKVEGTLTIYDHHRTVKDLIQIFSYALQSGQIDNLNAPIGAVPVSLEDTLVTGLYPGADAFDTSWYKDVLDDNSQEYIFTGNWAKNITHLQCTDLIHFVVDTISELSFGFNYTGTGGVVRLLYPDTGLFKNQKPTKLEFIENTTLNSQYQQFNQCILVKVFFGDLSYLLPLYLDHILAASSTSIGYCDFQNSFKSNKYVNGLSGHWTLKRALNYEDERTTENTTANIRKDGYHKSFNSYWKYNTSQWFTYNHQNRWKSPSETVLINQHGQALMSKDIIDRYSCVLYDNPLSTELVKAVASNAKLSQIGVSDFDYGFYGIVDQSSLTQYCPDEHWGFTKTDTIYEFDTLFAHTGKASLKIQKGKSVHNKHTVLKTVHHQNICKDCIVPFFPDTGSYIISAWVRTNVGSTNVQNRKASIVVDFPGTNISPKVLLPSGPIINGWQRISSVIHIPIQASVVKVSLVASSTEVSWFDDVRIHPFNAQLKSFVYNNLNFRLMAELDENNYATFYEYDEEGTLKRIKRETESGIITVKETRSHIPKNQ